MHGDHVAAGDGEAGGIGRQGEGEDRMGSRGERPEGDRFPRGGVVGQRLGVPGGAARQPVPQRRNLGRCELPLGGHVRVGPGREEGEERTGGGVFGEDDRPFGSPLEQGLAGGQDQAALALALVVAAEALVAQDAQGGPEGFRGDCSGSRVPGSGQGARCHRAPQEQRHGNGRQQLPLTPRLHGDQSEGISQPLRYERRTYFWASDSFPNRSSSAFHSSVVLGNRVATLPSRIASVSGPE